MANQPPAHGGDNAQEPTSPEEVRAIVLNIDNILGLSQKEQSPELGPSKDQQTEPTRSGEDRLKQLSESVTNLAHDLGQVRQYALDVHTMSVRQLQLSQEMYLRQESVLKTQSTRHAELKSTMWLLSKQIAALAQTTDQRSNPLPSTVDVSRSVYMPMAQGSAPVSPHISIPPSHTVVSPQGMAARPPLPASSDGPAYGMFGSPDRGNTPAQQQGHARHSQSPAPIFNLQQQPQIQQLQLQQQQQQHFQQQQLQQQQLQRQQLQQQQQQQAVRQQMLYQAQQMEAMQAKLEAERQAQEQRDKQEAEERARREAEEQARREVAERLIHETEERAKHMAEEQKKREAEEQAQRESAVQVTHETTVQDKRKVAERLKREAEERMKRKADAHAAEMQAKRNAEEQANREAQEQIRREAKERIRREAEEREKRESEERARREAAEQAERNAARTANILAEARAREAVRQKWTDQARESKQQQLREKLQEEQRRKQLDSARSDTAPTQAAALTISKVLSEVTAIGVPTPPSSANIKSDTPQGSALPLSTPVSPVKSPGPAAKAALPVSAQETQVTARKPPGVPAMPKTAMAASASSWMMPISLAAPKHDQPAKSAPALAAAPAQHNRPGEQPLARASGGTAQPVPKATTWPSGIPMVIHEEPRSSAPKSAANTNWGGDRYEPRRDQERGESGWGRDYYEPRRYDSWSRSGSGSRSRSQERTRAHPEPASSSRSSSRPGREPSPPPSELTIKGSTKHRLPSHGGERSPKRRHTSPQAGSPIMFSNSGSDSDSDDESDHGGVRVRGIADAKGAKKSMVSIVGASSTGNRDARTGVSESAGIGIASRQGKRAGLSNQIDGRLTPTPTELGNGWTTEHDGGVSSSSSSSSSAATSTKLTFEHALRDCSGMPITTERMDKLLGPFVFLGLPVIQPVYSMYYKVQPLRVGVSLSVLQRAMASLEQFHYWEPKHKPNGTVIGKTGYIARKGAGIAHAQRRISKRLFGTRAVPGPLLSYYLISLACNQIEHMSPSVIAAMFKCVTDRNLGDMWVITSRGVEQLSVFEYWREAKRWAIELTCFVAGGCRFQDAQDIPDRLYRQYVEKCRQAHPGARDPDPDGQIAQEMLATEEHGQLFVGLRSAELKQLFVYLGYMMGRMVSHREAKYLKELSDSFINMM
ncbi:hypothetical protein H4S01_002876 [Coemansia sp. RSA 2610]|nr:hypothetical protein H4S01_002876 [Coemansia sp. RSA 2610]